jgi:hypothetical protein
MQAIAPLHDFTSIKVMRQRKLADSLGSLAKFPASADLSRSLLLVMQVFDCQV